MKDYAPLGHPEPESVIDSAPTGPSDGLAGESCGPDDSAGGKQRNCLVCGQPLGVGNRKVHRGRCAVTRETQLQKERRRRRRT